MIVATVQLQRHMMIVCILSIIVSKLGYWYKPGLLVLFKINKDSEIQFYCTVLSLSLIVSLRVKSGKKSLFDIKKIAKR